MDRSTLAIPDSLHQDHNSIGHDSQDEDWEKVDQNLAEALTDDCELVESSESVDHVSIVGSGGGQLKLQFHQDWDHKQSPAALHTQHRRRGLRRKVLV